MQINFLFNDRYNIGQPVKYYIQSILPDAKAQVVNCFDMIDYNIEQLIARAEAINFDRLVFVCCHHSYNRFTENYTQLIEKFGTERIIALTGNGQYYHNYEPNLLYFPYYWYNGLAGPQRESFVPVWEFNEHLISNPRQYPISCLNNRYSWHRLMLFNCLYQRDYFTQILYSFNQILDESNLPDSDEKNCLIEVKNKYQNVLPIMFDLSGFECGTPVLGIDHPANTNSYLNVVTENSWGEAFVSEKTFKPIACGQFFLIFGGVGTIDLLRKMGFDVFDDYLDHSYDTESDMKIRAELIVKNLDHWMTLDQKKIWDETHQRRLSNAKLFFDLDVTKNPFDCII